MTLNAPQRAAILYTEGPLLVLAGAGSGKTRVITEKIAHLVTQRHLSGEKIAAITFTNKAAREMRERVARLLSPAVTESITIATFHALGLKFLHLEYAKAGLKRGFSVLDTDDTLAILKDLLPKGIKSDQLSAFQSLVSCAKNVGFTPEQAAERSTSSREQEAAELYGNYQRRLAAFNAVDFDDLIRLPLKILEADVETRHAWHERIRYLLVDEYQDSNIAQYNLLKLLSGESGAFTVVGDDDQSVYSWRGANPTNLHELSKDYPELKVIKLEQNYRCTRRILRIANAVIANNPHTHLKKLWSEHAEGPLVRVMQCRDDEHEAERVAGEIVHLAEKHKAQWNEFAILYRGNFQSRPLEKALRLAQIPYHITGGTAFLERTEVKDILAYLRLIANPNDDAAFLRIVNIPKKEIGATTLEKLGELAQACHLSLLRAAHNDSILKQLMPRSASALYGFCSLLEELMQQAKQLSATELCNTVLQRTRYADYLKEQVKDKATLTRRLENIDELGQWFLSMQREGSGTDELNAQLAILAYSDRENPGNTVRLMTLHSAKGLEFRFVNLIGLEEGTLPHEGSLIENRIEEERRLMYVGITRAKEHLTLSFAARKRRFGEIIKNTPSRFLEELPQDDLSWSGHDVQQDQAYAKEVATSHIARLANLLKD